MNGTKCDYCRQPFKVGEVPKEVKAGYKTYLFHCSGEKDCWTAALIGLELTVKAAGQTH